jgi:endonuclease YncB( thermonuclease family)
MIRAARFILALALACTLNAARADGFEGFVTHVGDGDTIWVRPAGGAPPMPIRLEGIDAPEICQAFGIQSRDALAAHILRRRVTVVVRGRDGYQRTIARIRFAGEDLGGWMVGRGYAWSYRFRSDPGPYRHQEAQARTARRGLWSSGRPEEPRAFRKRHGSCR